MEDEPFILDMISEELTGQGFSVLEAETGEAALSIFESGQMVDVLFTDIRLPGNWTAGSLPQLRGRQSPNCP